MIGHRVRIIATGECGEVVGFDLIAGAYLMYHIVMDDGAEALAEAHEVVLEDGPIN